MRVARRPAEKIKNRNKHRKTKKKQSKRRVQFKLNQNRSVHTSLLVKHPNKWIDTPDLPDRGSKTEPCRPYQSSGRTLSVQYQCLDDHDHHRISHSVITPPTICPWRNQNGRNFRVWRYNGKVARQNKTNLTGHTPTPAYLEFRGVPPPRPHRWLPPRETGGSSLPPAPWQLARPGWRG